jgi:tetratricopeptide (TPR) repeat protein
MECSTCKSVNDAGNRFCKECGSKIGAAPTPVEKAPEAPPTPTLAPEEIEKRRLRAAELLPRAMAFSEKGALAEAIATAEEAAGLNSGSIAAHTLLANLYEKVGQRERAIAAMKKVVALAPDDAAEKARLEALQREAARRAAAPTEPDDSEAPRSPLSYWLPRAGAALAGALVLGVGISLVTRPEEPTKKTLPRLAVGVQNPGAAYASAPSAPTGVRPQVFVPAPEGAAVDPFASKGFAPRPDPRQAESPLRRARRELPAPSPRRRLPRPDTDSSPSAPALVPPVSVSVPAQPVGESERIPVAPPERSERKSAPPPEEYIRIETHPASSAPEKKSEPEKKESDSGDPVQQARAFQGAGRYRDAVAEYRQALAVRSASGELHQNLALCYQRLGEPSAARDAYARAIDAYRRQLARGDDTESVQRGIASCQAALEVLGA